MIKTLTTTALISSLATTLAIYAIQPQVAAASPGEAPVPAALDWTPPTISMPEPQQPLDVTPITPFETVGGRADEPL